MRDRIGEIRVYEGDRVLSEGIDTLRDLVLPYISQVPDQREMLVSLLEEEGYIKTFLDPNHLPETVEGSEEFVFIDGSYKIVSLEALELLTATASAVPGISEERIESAREYFLVVTLPPGSRNASIAEALMTLLELRLMHEQVQAGRSGEAPQRMVVMDGGHITPLIALAKGLGARGMGRNRLYAQMRDWGATEYLRTLLFDPLVLCSVKHDSSRLWTRISEGLLQKVHREVTLLSGDKYLASVVLEQGQYLAPQLLSNPGIAEVIRVLSMGSQGLVEGERFRRLCEVLQEMQEEEGSEGDEGLGYESPEVEGTGLEYTYFLMPGMESAFRIEWKHDLVDEQAPKHLFGSVNELLCALSTQHIPGTSRELTGQFFADLEARRCSQQCDIALDVIRSMVNVHPDAVIARYQLQGLRPHRTPNTAL